MICELCYLDLKFNEFTEEWECPLCDMDYLDWEQVNRDVEDAKNEYLDELEEI